MSLPEPYYEDDAVTLYHGDCREILPMLDVGGAVLVTDPPYGIGHASNRTAPTTTAEWMNEEIEGDSDTAARDWALSRFNDWAVTATYETPAPEGWRDVLVWDKGPASGMGDLSFPWKRSWELVYVAGSGWEGRRDEGVLKGFNVVTRASMGRTHPNEKPVSLMEHIIGKHPSPTVMDPFAGSGTTLVAAKNLGRQAAGIEIKEKYCEIAAERLSQETLDLGAA